MTDILQSFGTCKVKSIISCWKDLHNDHWFFKPLWI